MSFFVRIPGPFITAQCFNSTASDGMRSRSCIPFSGAGFTPVSSLLLHRCLCLCCLLLIALNHDDAQETTNHCRPEENEDDWNANCPDARREEALEGVVLIDEWLQLMSLECTIMDCLDIP